MARLVTYEPSLRVVDITLNQRFEHEIHRIQSTGSKKIFETGPGKWRGSVRFGARSNRVFASKAEAFFSSLNGQENYFDLPLTGIKVGSGLPTTVTSGNEVSGYNFANNAIFLNNGGYYWSVNNRLLIQLNGSAPYRFWPSLSWSPGQVIATANVIRIQQEASGVNMTISPHWSGDWSMRFEEYVT